MTRSGLRYLGLDFGGTKLALGVADAAGHLLAARRRPTAPAAGAAGAIAAMEEMFRDLGEATRGIAAVGISFGGPVDPTRTRTLLSHHGPGWEDVPLVEQVSRRWGCPAVMDNDANVAALGEARFGAARGKANALYVTVSTGIGGGIILGGRLYRGSRGLSGEIGHTLVDPAGPPCPCGKRGCLEALAAGPAIARTYAERSGDVAVASGAEEVFARAARDDALARVVLDDATRALAIGLANAINLLDPDVVVVGGGVSRAGDALFVPLRAKLRAFCAPSPADAVPVVPAALGDAVGILGAIALAATGE